MPAQLHLKYSDKNFYDIFSGLQFSLDLNFSNDELYFAELDPPLKIENDELKFIHFHDFSFSGRSFVFMTPNRAPIPLPNDLKDITLTIISPKPVPLRDEWSIPLSSNEDDCFAQLFYYPQDMETSENYVNFITTLKTKWNKLGSDVEELLKTSELGKFGISVGIMKKADEIPELESIDTFFSSPSSFKKGSKIMVVVISSFKEFTLSYKRKILFTKGVPTVPKDLLLRKIKMIIESNQEKEPIDESSKLLIKALFNGGIPSNLFAKYPKLLEKSINGDNVEFFERDDFDKLILNLDFLDSENIDYHTILKQPLESLKDHLFTTSNKATLKSLFWNPILNLLFFYGQEGRDKNFCLSSDFNIGQILPHIKNEEIDFVSSIKPGSKRQAILLVEIGVEPFYCNNFHKDFSKLIGAMSLSCIQMARELLSLKKTPESARVYGILIGELKFQLLVAHPKLIRLEDGNYEVHAEILFEDYWFFDMLAETRKVASDVDSVLESVQKGRFSQHGYTYSDFSFNEEQSKSFSKLFSLEESIKTETKSEEKEETLLQQGNVNIVALKRLHAFIEIVKKRIDLIMNEEPNPNETRQISPDSHFGYIDTARPSTTQDTPYPDQISNSIALKKRRFYEEATKGISQPNFRITKESGKELKILRRLSVFPNFFAKLYSAKIDEENNRVDYVFERLLPLVNSHTNMLSSNICAPSAMESIFYCLKFAVDCLMALHLLHDNLGVVHSDISVNNIMFSYKDDTWKIIDFDQSLELEESLKTSRKAGTTGFIAPESLETGIFTTKSDIFSLGKVIIDYLNPFLVQQFLLDDSTAIDPKLREMFNGFTRTSLSMISTDPEKRPSAIEALETMYKLYYHFEFDDKEHKYVAIKNTLAQNLVKEIKQIKSIHVQEEEHKFEEETKEAINAQKKLKITEINHLC